MEILFYIACIMLPITVTVVSMIYGDKISIGILKDYNPNLYLEDYRQ